jgi:hypothetical protein
MNHFLFIDESGDHGLINIDENFPVFVLCGVLISEESYTRLSEEMSTIKEHFWRRKKVILHSRDIRKCEKEFQVLFDINVKQKFYKRINSMINAGDYTIIASAIHKDKHIKKYGKLAQNIYEISLSFVIERAMFALDDKQVQSDSLKIIIEKRGKTEDNKLKDYFNKLLQRGTGYIDKNRMLRHNLEIEFRDKKENIEGLQLADLLAYPIARYVLDKQRANPAYDLLEAKFYYRDGKNYGLKEFP